MTGNDVIDLSLSRGLFRKFKSDRLNEKIFSKIELAELEEEDHQTLLRKWTMKEAAYKAYQRYHQQNAKFNPFDIHTDILGLEYGQAFIHGQKIPLRTFIFKDHIYTIVDGSTTNFSIRYRSASDLSYQLSIFFQSHDWTIRKDVLNIPTLYRKDEAHPISITHHGDFNYLLINE